MKRTGGVLTPKLTSITLGTMSTEQTLIEWTRELDDQATAEGWAIFHAARNDRHMYDLQKIDEPELWGDEVGIPVLHVWEDDVDAWVFVRDTPSPLHAIALEFLRINSPEEYETIMGWEEEQDDS